MSDLSAISALSRRYPLLDADEECELARRARRGDRQAADALVLSHVRLCVAEARRYRGFEHYGITTDDLAMAGVAGLVKAADRFDPERGTRFAVFALPYIKAEIKIFVRHNVSPVRAPESKAARSLFWRLNDAKRRLGVNGTLNDEQAREIARQFGTTPETVRFAEMHRAGTASLDVRLSADPGAATWLETFADDRPTQEDVLIKADEKAHQKRLIDAALAELDPRSRDVLIARFLEEERETFATLARRHRISRARAQQIEQRALAHMRESLGGAGAGIN